MKNIEVEARSFITPQKFKELKRLFDKKGKFLYQDFDETVYFKAKKDLRIRQDSNSSYLIFKEGKIHDKYRKEIELPLLKNKFKELEDLITSLGFPVDVRWYRVRRVYRWRGVNAYLWATKGYGYIIELEKFASEREKEKVHKKLTKLLEFFHTKITPRKEFEKKLGYYKKHWQRLTRFGSKKPHLPT